MNNEPNYERTQLMIIAGEQPHLNVILNSITPPLGPLQRQRQSQANALLMLVVDGSLLLAKELQSLLIRVLMNRT